MPYPVTSSCPESRPTPWFSEGFVPTLSLSRHLQRGSEPPIKWVRAYRLHSGLECGTLPVMSNPRPDRYLDTAKAAAEYARKVRSAHARRTDRRSPQRETDVRIALERLREAMVPLRSLIGSFPYRPQTPEATATYKEVRKASDALQKERRKLWKLIPRKKEEPQDA